MMRCCIYAIVVAITSPFFVIVCCL